MNEILLSEHLGRFDIDSFSNNENALLYLEFFGHDLIHYYNLYYRKIDLESVNNVLYTVENQHTTPYFIDLCDLARLHFVCLKNRVTSVLELGSGHSTFFLAHAMYTMKLVFGSRVSHFNRISPVFSVHSVDESKDFLEITSARIPDTLSAIVHFYHSSVEVREHDGRICTVYDSLPDVGFDLLYLDGPSQYASPKSVGGISFNKPFRFPLSFDPLRLEFFMEPGSIVLVDGRTTNVSFLKAYFKRSWRIHQNIKQDFSIFTLIDSPLGEINLNKLAFRDMLNND